MQNEPFSQYPGTMGSMLPEHATRRATSRLSVVGAHTHTRGKLNFAHLDFGYAKFIFLLSPTKHN
jgi:hypothetical protein